MAQLKMFSIFDAAAKAYGPPMVFHTTGLALREFEDICKNQQSQLYKSQQTFLSGKSAHTKPTTPNSLRSRW